MGDEMKIEDAETLGGQKEEFKTCLSSIEVAAKKNWDQPFLDYYTKHDITHSHEVIKLLDKILKCGNCVLNEHERFILLAAAYLHDIGMQFPKYIGLPPKSKNDYTYEERERVREKHHEISAKVILDSPVSLGLGECKERYPDFIATVSKYHRKLPLDAEELEDTSMAGETIRLRLLSALLRLADALDLTYKRVNLELLKQWDIPFESKMYWYVHYYVQSVDIDKNGCIKVLLGLPKKYKEDNKIIGFFENKIKETIKRHLSDVYKILWQHDIKLYNPEESPEITTNYLVVFHHQLKFTSSRYNFNLSLYKS
ncbi:MAG: HD domain-containing protein [Canidatus Methanoxibalbensis ujae]|nr:HD domain-containing protein [Candidatus Methanoxibalbensis ujae]